MDAAGVTQVYAHQGIRARVSLYGLSADAGAPSPETDLAGAMLGHPVTTTLSTGQTVLMAASQDGRLWARQQIGTTAGTMGAWQELPTPAPVSGDLALTALGDGTAGVVARTRAGELIWATYSGPNRQLRAPFAQLPGAGFTGRPVIVIYNGVRMRIVATTTSPTSPVQTIMQTGVEGPFEPQWTPVGEPSSDIQGNISAVHVSQTGKVMVVGRTSVRQLRYAEEVEIGSATWSPWQPFNATPTNPDGVTATVINEPTTYTFGSFGSPQSGWGVVIQMVDGQIVALQNSSGSQARFQKQPLGTPKNATG